MEKHKCNQIAEIAKLKADAIHLDEKVDIVSNVMFGNGSRKGLKEKLDRLLGGIAAFKWLGGGGGVAGIIALAITIIKFYNGG